MKRTAHITIHPATDARIFHREAQCLRELGWNVTVAGAHPADDIREGIQIRRLDRYPGRIKRMLTSWWNALGMVRAIDADIYHFHDPALLPTALLVKTFLGKKVVFDAHEDVGLLFLRDWLPDWAKRPLVAVMDAVDRYCARRMDGWVVTTFRHEEYYRRLTHRLTVFHNFPAPRFLQARDQAWLPYEQRENNIIHLGTISLPRLKILVEIARRFLADYPDWKFIILGMHPPMLEWFKQHVTGNICDRLVGIGKIPHEDVAQHLCKARIGVNYHKVGSRQIQHVIPLKVFEYLASGLPTITTKVPALYELIHDCPAVTWAPEDVDKYYAQLAALVNRNDRNNLSMIGPEYCAKHIDCRQEAVRLSDMYHRILRGE